MKLKKISLLSSTTLLIVFPLASLGTTFEVASKNDQEISTTTIYASEIRNKVRIFNTNFPDFTADGNKTEGYFAPQYFKNNPLVDEKGQIIWDQKTKNDVLAKAHWGLVQNYLSAFDNTTTTLNWSPEQKVGKDYLTFNNGLEIKIEANPKSKLAFVDDRTNDDNYGTGQLSSDNKTLVFKMSADDTLTSYYNSYLNYDKNFGVFNKNEDFRITMDRLGKSIYYKPEDYKPYTAEEMRKIWEPVIRGVHGDYNNWISYDKNVINDYIYLAAANFANAVIENDDNLLGYVHYANEFSKYDNVNNQAIMTMDGGPVPDADRLTLIMNDFVSNYQSAGDIYNINESQYGVDPYTIVMNEGANISNKYLEKIRPNLGEPISYWKSYNFFKEAITDPSVALSNTSALWLMTGIKSIQYTELYLATSMAYSTIDADRAYLLGKYLKEQKKEVEIDNKLYQLPKYQSIAIAGRSHGMHATLDTIFFGRHQKEYLTEIIDRAFAEKNTLFPIIVNANNDTGFSAYNQKQTFKPSAAALPDDNGIDWEEQLVNSGKATDLYFQFEHQPIASIHYFNLNADSTRYSNYLDVPFDYINYNKDVLPPLNSTAFFRPFNLTKDSKYMINFNYEDDKPFHGETLLYNENQMMLTRRFVHQIFGYYDIFNQTLKSSKLGTKFLKDFILNNLYLERSVRDPNIGLIWQEEIDWAKDNNLNMEIRDDRPDLQWFNHNSDNNSRGAHHSEPTLDELSYIFNNEYL